MTHISYEWIQATDLTKFQPVSQVYGICFNDIDEILIIKKPDGDQWKIPGGRPEAGETLEETLNRELMEEATISVKNCQPLGVMQVVYPHLPICLKGNNSIKPGMFVKLSKCYPIPLIQIMAYYMIESLFPWKT